MSKENEVVLAQNQKLKTAEQPFVRPSTDVYETSESYVVRMDMPGVVKESIQVTIEGDTLMVRSVAGPSTIDQPGLLLSEIRNAGYARSFNLGEGIDRNGIEARYENGVLSVKLHKKEEVRPKEITIR